MSSRFRKSRPSASPAAFSPAGSSTARTAGGLTRNPGLPSSRAVVGALLVTVAVVGTFGAVTGATGTSTRSVVVASRDLPVGTRVQANDLRVVQVEIDSGLADHVVQNTKSAVGHTLLGPVKAGELLQTGAVTTKDTLAAKPEVSFQLPSARALGGDLRSGETVDVLVTDKNANSATNTSVAVHDARVVRVERSSSGLGNSADVTVVLSVSDGTQAAAVVGAIDVGQVTLVRTTGLQA